MIIIASKEEKELITRLRQIGSIEKVDGLSAEIVALKREITQLEIDKSKIKEEHAKEERELRHMIGLEKKRQEFEITQAKRETTVQVREENLAADKKRFEENLAFNNERFESMEKTLKDLLKQVLERLPNVNVKLGNRK